MSIADELLKLHKLHEEGMLTDEELEKAKVAVLVAPLANPAADRELEVIRRQNEIAQLDREWQIEREQYMVAGRYGGRYIPGRASSVIGGLVIVAFGIFWTAMAAGVGAPGFFPIFGVVFVLFGLGVSVVTFIKAARYAEAYRLYRQRRAALLGTEEPRADQTDDRTDVR